MKLTNPLHKFRARFLGKILRHDTHLDSLNQLCIVLVTAIAIWFGGEYLNLNGSAPLSQPEKRLYVILVLLLVWFLKFLIWDLDAPNPLQYTDPHLRKKLLALQRRFKGACQFLKKTTATHHGTKTRLDQLNWHLLIGPRNAGKTTLLAQSNVPFILQRQFADKDSLLEPSENCDWWVTRDICLIDVPGKYMLPASKEAKQQKSINYSVLWQFFLRLIKRQRGKNGVKGVVIALPLPEIMQQNDIKKYHLWIRDVFQRLQDIQHLFATPVPCQLVITKCDLLPGFAEFFAELGEEELTQAWGIKLAHAKSGEKTEDLFTHHFNQLIKKLNQQLLWRLHQERNPMARPYIKDFPLQVERLKEFVFDFIKRSQSSNINLAWQSVYMTSALQTKAQEENVVLDEANHTQRGLQIFKEPTPSSRAYFIKQFITHGLTHIRTEKTPVATTAQRWKRYTTYAVSFSIIGFALFILGRDFQRGLNQTYEVQNNLMAYKTDVQRFHNSDAYLAKTLVFLNTLQQQSVEPAESKFDFFSFYSRKSNSNAGRAYQQALQIILLPEVRDHLAEFLKIPVNQNAETVYAALKAYLMLGNTSRMQLDYLLNTVQQTLPKSLNRDENKQFIQHLSNALNASWTPLPINVNVVQQTRRYLTALPSLQLSYIILKNIGNNNQLSALNWGDDKSVFVQPIAPKIPTMFTVRAFGNIMTQQTALAAQEATMGNWVLSDEIGMNKSSDYTNDLIQQLRTAYVNNYVTVWENVLSNIQIVTPKNLAQTDIMIINTISNNSPLLQVLQTVHDNTYFEPVSSLSEKLKNVGMLMDKTVQNALLYQVLTNLQSLHEYIRTVIVAENESKAAFNIISNRILHLDKPDAITQLRLIADRSPEPIKTWLNKITNDTWRFLMQEACNYIDVSWQNKIVRHYQTNIADRFPFSVNTQKDVALEKFTQFFGNQGLILSFYKEYLENLVDTSTPDWRWKTLDNKKLPFSDETLRQIQQAIRINNLFFANNSAKPFLQFTLQPLRLGRQVKSVKLNINNNQIVDEKGGKKNSHTITWPSENMDTMTSLQLTLLNQKSFNQEFPGDWGLFKLVNQSFESMANKKSIVINLSINENTAKYLLQSNGKINPFLSLDFRHFHLPQQITNQKA